jgi:hypothetical protein
MNLNISKGKLDSSSLSKKSSKLAKIDLSIQEKDSPNVSSDGRMQTRSAVASGTLKKHLNALKANSKKVGTTVSFIEYTGTE